MKTTTAFLKIGDIIILKNPYQDDTNPFNDTIGKVTKTSLIGVWIEIIKYKSASNLTINKRPEFFPMGQGGGWGYELYNNDWDT